MSVATPVIIGMPLEANIIDVGSTPKSSAHILWKEPTQVALTRLKMCQIMTVVLFIQPILCILMVTFLRTLPLAKSTNRKAKNCHTKDRGLRVEVDVLYSFQFDSKIRKFYYFIRCNSVPSALH